MNCNLLGFNRIAMLSVVTMATIKTISILNLDAKLSTITNQELIGNVDSNSTVVSDCDEELLILIEFHNITQVHNIKFYASNLPDDYVDMSAPKTILIYKTKHLNVNFDDVANMKYDKRISCSTKKLNKGQVFKLNNNIKFKYVKYLVIHIKSNQNGTEQTYLNGISFNVNLKPHSKYDTSHINNDKELSILVNELSMHEDDVKQEREKYLFKQTYANNDCKLDLVTCDPFIRIKKLLQRYHLIIRQIQQNNNTNNNIYNDKYDNIQLINDFNHLLCYHARQFEDIYNTLLTQINDNKPCDLKQCISMQRNHRDRNIADLQQVYFNCDDKNIITQQLIDRIHAYYFHSFDIAHKITRIEMQNIVSTEHKTDDEEIKIDGNCNDRITSQTSRLVTYKRQSYANITQFTRLNSPNNKFIMQQDANPNQLDEYSYGYRYFYWKHY
eukprot:481896_1